MAIHRTPFNWYFEVFTSAFRFPLLSRQIQLTAFGKWKFPFSKLGVRRDVIGRTAFNRNIALFTVSR